MFGTFLFELRHLHLHEAWVDPVAPHRVIGPLAAHLPQQPSHSKEADAGSSSSVAAAAAITDRTTKCPIDKAYNSCSTPVGV